MSPVLDTVLDAAAAVCLVVGALMSLAAAIGLVRFPDLLTRMHAGTKPQVFGLLLMLTAVALENRDPVMIPLIVLGWIFQLLTVPVSAHMVGRSTYRSKHLNRNTLTQDDLQEVLNRAGKSATESAMERATESAGESHGEDAAGSAAGDAAGRAAAGTPAPSADGRRADGQQTDGSAGTR
ncbi:sodium:proton antiporter [Kocuria rosea subsp. polaris]|uniref:Sodium:proton antiporter n=1 Tax=Kocuria rosea subsp. polaris TaxID=136273 RepID=A0A0W8ILG3_KOCRO|nr:sodium:proton antiporter [Kocuria polaris]